jgi:pimeloyl-ACP methyl ester carboxylesterase
MTDSSRTYKPGTQAGAHLHYRPLEIDLWYPATAPASATNSAPETAIEYGQFLRLLQDRSNRFQDDTIYREMTSELLGSLCAGLHIADTSALTRLKTISHEDAIPVHRRFPLIIYMCSFNGMGFENIHLFENLASHGYVVASITSVGQYPGNMSTDPADLMEQVEDGLFTIRRLKYCPDVDPDRIGVIGYSWGGPAALLLSMNTPDVKAVLSLDGSEMHYYGESATEDSDFDRLRQSPAFSIERLHAAYTYLESSDKQADRQVDSIFNIFPLLAVPHRYIRFPETKHEDFSSLPSLAAQLNDVHGHYRLNPFDKFTLYYFDRQLKDQPSGLSTYLAGIWRQQGDSNYHIVKAPGPAIVISGRVFDARDKAPLAYVNVGIPGKHNGTVTRRDGGFTLAIGVAMTRDSIQFSMAGYRHVTTSIDRLLHPKRSLSFFLEEKVTDLQEVMVTSRAPVTRRLGNRSTSKSVSIGFPMRYLGAELGIRIRLGRRPVSLRSFTFNVSASRLDTAIFRLNICSFNKGVISEDRLERNILVPVGKSVGPHTVDLSGYHLTMSGDILVSLELIEGASSGSTPGVLYLSAGFLNTATWRRATSQAAWKKAPGIGVGFNIVVRE